MFGELTVEGIRARPLDLPLARPIETAAATLRTTPLVLVDVFTREGVTGCSYASVYSPLVLEPLARLIENLAELIGGKSADPTTIGDTLARHFNLLGLQGLTGIAAATLDMALWDMKAKAAGLPLAALLGGELRPIRTYASLPSMSAGPAAADAGSARKLGFTALKLKLGRGELADDLATIHAVREVVGSDVELMVDYNQAFTVEEAIERGRALDIEALTWIEEPTRADDYEGHARIAAAIETPLQLGENAWGPNDLEKIVAARASQHVMFDAMKIGGPSGWLRAAELASAASLPVSTHVFPELSAHLLAVTPTAHRLEYVDKVGPILQQPTKIQDGHVLLPDTPGIGINWDEQAISLAIKS